ncbi:TetR/AcrR family transcriptional regulator [Microbulbifer sp. S227A]|uniref:TetR/AcrR family transcriptional regulator n=1 Tax=Microbulbifer sp. S227A TaxID=3415131 RepID=UPI003C7D624E
MAGLQEWQGGGQRRDAILAAAAELFFEQGFAETSIDAIIKRVGGSKRNIYALFGNKAGLFKAIVVENAEQLFSEPVPEPGSTERIDEALEGFALRLLELVTNPRTRGIYRLITREATRFPELGRIYFELGPRRGRDWLARTLTVADQRGEVRVDDPELAATHFLGMVRGDLMFELLLGQREAPDPAELRLRARTATATFLDGIRADSV